MLFYLFLLRVVTLLLRYVRWLLLVVCFVSGRHCSVFVVSLLMFVVVSRCLLFGVSLILVVV